MPALRFNSSMSPGGLQSLVFPSTQLKHWRQCPLCWLSGNSATQRTGDHCLPLLSTCIPRPPGRTPWQERGSGAVPTIGTAHSASTTGGTDGEHSTTKCHSSYEEGSRAALYHRPGLKAPAAWPWPPLTPPTEGDLTLLDSEATETSQSEPRE